MCHLPLRSQAMLDVESSVDDELIRLHQGSYRSPQLLCEVHSFEPNFLALFSIGDKQIMASVSKLINSRHRVPLKYCVSVARVFQHTARVFNMYRRFVSLSYLATVTRC